VIQEASALAAEIRKGSRSARDTVAGAIHITQAQQERFNVATFVDEEQALVRADTVDRAVASGHDPGPLAGVPIAIKDLIDREGHDTTCGSAWYRRKATQTAPALQRVEASGAVIISRTGLHEFAYGFSSENEWFGPVRNPLDPELSTGGSSGGSAAAVAAGQVPIAIGTDTGGSVRVPASLCGVFGLKVTHGRIPLTGVFPLAESLDTVGPIARTVGDLSLAYGIMAGFHTQDPWSVPRPVIAPGTRPDLSGLKIGLPVEWLDSADVTEEVATGFAGVVPRLRELGAEVMELSDPELTPPGMAMELSAVEAANVHRSWVAEGKDYGSEVRERLRKGMSMGIDVYLEAMRWRARLRQRTALAFSQFDLLVTPATGASRKPLGQDTIATLNGDRHYRAVLSAFTALVNSMGVPALAGPIADSGSPPIGLQLIAPWWKEHVLLEVGALMQMEGVMSIPAV